MSDNWEKAVQDALISSSLHSAGASTFACMVATMLSKGATIERNSLLQLMRDCVAKAKAQGNAEYYAETLLALRFLEDVLAGN